MNIPARYLNLNLKILLFNIYPQRSLFEHGTRASIEMEFDNLSICQIIAVKLF